MGKASHFVPGSVITGGFLEEIIGIGACLCTQYFVHWHQVHRPVSIVMHLVTPLQAPSMQELVTHVASFSGSVRSTVDALSSLFICLLSLSFLPFIHPSIQFVTRFLEAKPPCARLQPGTLSHSLVRTFVHNIYEILTRTFSPSSDSDSGSVPRAAEPLRAMRCNAMRLPTPQRRIWSRARQLSSSKPSSSIAPAQIYLLTGMKHSVSRNTASTLRRSGITATLPRRRLTFATRHKNEKREGQVSAYFQAVGASPLPPGRDGGKLQLR
ncbi:hypothetical protein BBK36DRAFT_143284 [Trichoderma citrinoviride]|uniref:Uncharacterized protein n=1 Tax=Trichoderma citrinoviride TaxID=58853 RepID=A0A2T4B561_9HYPO|nr:hypothetical protein BBK36DRAFT_143284 [Trichoderma citrinoviride]PTB64440.1 hypothetical protein BBK36DRAFT_143284 [Trichoderma citrinoviride]